MWGRMENPFGEFPQKSYDVSLPPSPGKRLEKPNSAENEI